MRKSSSLSWLFSPTKFGRIFYFFIVGRILCLHQPAAQPASSEKNKRRHYSARVKRWAVLVASFCYMVIMFGYTPLSVQAQTSDLQQGVQIIQQPLGLPATDIRIIIAQIIRVALGLLGIVLLVIVLYGGYLWMTSGGNEEKIGEAKKIVVNSSIGLAIILSAFTIVSFILKLLGVPGGVGLGGEVGGPGTQNFQGSGALGGIIRDHYPTRDQKDVPRNTKIIITFRKPILLTADWVAEKGDDGKLGTCVLGGGNIDWENKCDQIKNIADGQFLSITRSDTGQPIRGANILAAFENNKIYTIVVRPLDTLGSDTDNVSYRVHLGKGILLDDPANNNPPAFNRSVLGNDYYEWQFTCNTTLDRTPPYVVSVFPAARTREVKNSVIQIDFSEPVDPIGLQGAFSDTQDNNNSFVVDGNTVYLKSAYSTKPTGTFRLSNGYRTLEFTPDKQCGVNACGGKIFCLPVCDGPNANCPADPVKQDTYEVLLRAAQTVSKNSFEAIPFSGAMDLSGNALDGNKNSQVESATTTLPVFPTWKQPDNFFWTFILKDELDITSPYIAKIAPGLDGEFVGARDPWQIIMSKRLRVESIYDIGIEEKPSPRDRGDNIPLCKLPRAWFNIDGSTQVIMDHCPFLDKIRQYYFPVVSSSIEDAHFNCLYPALGPGDKGNNGNKAGGTSFWSNQGGAHRSESLTCDGGNPAVCCPVSSSSPGAAFCCNGLANVLDATTTPRCLQQLRGDSL